MRAVAACPGISTVATALNLSVKTVRHYLDRAFAKPGVHTRTEAARVFAAHPFPRSDFER